MTGEDRATSPHGAAETWAITASIPYVNAAPHVGFALELIQADVLARNRRQRGAAVWFQTGSDENSLKNVQAAQRLGRETADLVAENAASFAGLWETLNLSSDDFIRTSAEPRHRRGVERLWRACAAAGDIYSKDYSGLYCIGCERFMKPAELEDGRCPLHGTEPDRVAERNYFFRLGRYQRQLTELLRQDRIQILPARRRTEILRFIEDGLEDFSISRSIERAHGWGIPVPDDPGQVMYVWFDALGNYVTALDYADDGPLFDRYWQTATERVHVIGKDITRFHAIYWPAMLLSAGIALPTRILVHGFLTVDGRKISKSAGTAIDPAAIVDAVRADALRYYLLRAIRSGEDGDFSLERLESAYRSDLAGQFGNLAHRVLAMTDRYCEGRLPADDRATLTPLAEAGASLPDRVNAAIDRFAFHEALAEIWGFIGEANAYVNATAPWALAKQRDGAAAADEARHADAALSACLGGLLSALETIATVGQPFLPAACDRLLARLDPVSPDPDRSPLFPPRP